MGTPEHKRFKYHAKLGERRQHETQAQSQTKNMSYQRQNTATSVPNQYFATDDVETQA